MPVDTRNIHMPAIDRFVVETMQKFIENELKIFSDICTAADVYKVGQNRYILKLTIKKAHEEITASFIELDILRNHPIVVIHTIVTPSEIAHRGLGKKLIWELFQASIKNSHDLVIKEVVPSFMRSLLKRGAYKLNGDNIQITKYTDLLNRPSA